MKDKNWEEEYIKCVNSREYFYNNYYLVSGNEPSQVCDQDITAVIKTPPAPGHYVNKGGNLVFSFNTIEGFICADDGSIMLVWVEDGDIQTFDCPVDGAIWAACDFHHLFTPEVVACSPNDFYAAMKACISPK